MENQPGIVGLFQQKYFLSESYIRIPQILQSINYWNEQKTVSKTIEVVINLLRKT